VGDITSSIRVFSKRQADEMIIYDLDARQRGRFNSNLIKYAVANCNMPLTMGGGIRTVEDASVLIDGGCDKISVSSLLYENMKVVSNIARKYGAQAVVATLDYRSVDNKRCFFSNNGEVSEGDMDLHKVVKKLIEHGVGEIVFNSIDRDGTMTGFDKALIDSLVGAFKLPFVISGGCKSSDDMHYAEQRGISGAAAGSIFHWKGDSIISLKKELLEMGSNVRIIL
jgi:imidazole glycerol-phosphate synthase subunit HisF